MRIAIDCRSAFNGMGGIGRYAWSLLHTLLDQDHENDYVAYFTHLEPPRPLRTHPRLKVRIFQAGVIDERFDQLIIPTVIHEDKVDIYHNPMFAAPVVRTRARVVSTIHDVVFLSHPELVEPKLRSYLERATGRAVKCADLLLTVSEFSRQEISRHCAVSSNRVRAIHNGVTPSSSGKVTNTSYLRDLGLEPGGYVLYVGSIEPKKNLAVLLEAFAAMLERGAWSGCDLVLAGANTEIDAPLARWLSDPRLRHRVKVTGYVSEDVLEELYARSLFFVYPSLYEGFGLPDLEAMSRGIPTIVADCSSLPEIVGDGAVLVDPNSAELWAREMETLRNDAEKRRELSARGKARALRFTWERTAQQHLEVYRELARKCHEAAPSCV